MKHRFKLFLIIALCLIQLGVYIRYGFSGQEAIIFVFNLLLTILYVSRLRGVKQDMFSLFYLISIVCSLHVVAFFQIYDPEKFTYYENDFRHLASFANEVLFVALLSCITWGAVVPYKKYNPQTLVITRHYSQRLVRTVFILAILASLTCAALGLDRMGAEVKTVLPFHLNGILNTFRNAIMPFLISLYVYDKTAANGKGLSNTEWIAIFVFGVFEVFARLSKSTLAMIFIPAFVVLLFLKRINKSFVIKVLIPAIALFLALYPIIGLMRYYDDVNSNTLKSASSEVSNSEESRLTAIYSRVFEAGEHYIRSYQLLEKDYLFDFSRAPLIIIEGGSAAFFTHVVDGFADDAKHSSGTTGITDPYLFGGKGFCFIVLCLLSLFGRIVDRHNNTKQILYIVWAFLLYYKYVLFVNVSSFIGPTAISFIVTEFLELLFIYYYYKRRTILVPEK